ncbi:hypothetical protein CFO_g1820 [Ceratocystis platani]|uniref:Uncharacterized protein n=1 Tax=Ceratocystis fimbriata f. sp. platani TaxID=88771 RepID=A0A0F8CYU1_CERFI|nr:hypothetical protein CFO_g1820 [Ceratocystis platani]
MFKNRWEFTARDAVEATLRVHGKRSPRSRNPGAQSGDSPGITTRRPDHPGQQSTASGSVKKLYFTPMCLFPSLEGHHDQEHNQGCTGNSTDNATDNRVGGARASPAAATMATTPTIFGAA